MNSSTWRSSSAVILVDYVPPAGGRGWRADRTPRTGGLHVWFA